MNPKAKTNILVEELPEETLVYDLDRHRAHCLNPTAAFLLGNADGTRSVAELTRMAEESFGEPATEEVIEVGLDRLARSRLVEWDDSPVLPEGVSRRKAIRQLATIGLAVPAVMTVVSPLAAQATGIPTKDCGLQTVGRCCVNNKLCIQRKNGSYACAEPGC